jgi:hypothetical protein
MSQIVLDVISTNNIATGMVRGSQVRFQSHRDTYKLPVRFYFPIEFGFSVCNHHLFRPNTVPSDILLAAFAALTATTVELGRLLRPFILEPNR